MAKEIESMEHISLRRRTVSSHILITSQLSLYLKKRQPSIGEMPWRDLRVVPFPSFHWRSNSDAAMFLGTSEGQFGRVIERVGDIIHVLSVSEPGSDEFGWIV